MTQNIKPNLRYQAIVFDFDGTLVDSNSIKREGFFKVVAGHQGGISRITKILCSSSGDRLSIMEAYIKSCPPSILPAKTNAQILTQVYSDYVDYQVANAPAISGALELLIALSEGGLSVYLNSATPIDSLRKIIKQRGWDKYFNSIFGSPTTKYEALVKICDITGLAAKDVAVVGDGQDDRESATLMGCHFFSVGEARGATLGEHVFNFKQLANVFLSLPD